MCCCILGQYKYTRSTGTSSSSVRFMGGFSNDLPRTSTDRRWFHEAHDFGHRLARRHSLLVHLTPSEMIVPYLSWVIDVRHRISQTPLRLRRKLSRRRVFGESRVSMNACLKAVRDPPRAGNVGWEPRYSTLIHSASCGMVTRSSFENLEVQALNILVLGSWWQRHRC